jgi:hypothetical protein
MDSRTAGILGQIRLYLKEISQQNVQNGELLYHCNQAQRQILLETKCIEKDYDIQFSGVQEYDFEEFLIIKEIFPSWSGKIDYIKNNEWINYKDLTGGNPAYCTVFGSKIYFAPVPTTGSVKIWAYQSDLETEMEDNVPPEVPKICDRAIVLWVTAQYRPELIAEYDKQIKLIKSNLHTKTNKPKESYPNW